ncbi:MAG: glycosyltransferase family 2 protein, partial [Anaerolineae bacterium]|nr:glycosyltransferase family 2 protein [Anaerolineae bacterium]
HRPLLFFGVPGVALLLIGLVLGWQVVDVYNRFENLAVGTALIVVLLLLGGVFFLFTGIILHALRILMDEIKANLMR